MSIAGRFLEAAEGAVRESRPNAGISCELAVQIFKAMLP
jgi:hypothetical protein